MGMAQQVVGTQVGQMQGRRSREAQEVLYDSVEPAHLGAGDVDASRCALTDLDAGLLDVFLQQLQLDIDGAEGVAHLMGDGGGEAAERRHLLRLPHGPFGPLQVGDFRECQQRAQGGGVVVGEVHRVNS